MTKLINKSAINTNRTTNATGALAMFGGLAAAIGGITNGEPIYVWFPAVCLSLSGAISQWLQGEPSKETLMIAKALDLQPGMSNSDLARNLVRRFVADQPKPAPTPEPPIAQPSRPIPPASSPQLPNIPVPPADFAKWQADRLAHENAEITQI